MSITFELILGKSLILGLFWADFTFLSAKKFKLDSWNYLQFDSAKNLFSGLHWLKELYQNVCLDFPCLDIFPMSFWFIWNLDGIKALATCWL